MLIFRVKTELSISMQYSDFWFLFFCVSPEEGHQLLSYATYKIITKINFKNESGNKYILDN